MFNRIVSNFRKKSIKTSRKSLSDSLSSTEIFGGRANLKICVQEFAMNASSILCEENLSNDDCEIEISPSLVDNESVLSGKRCSEMTTCYDDIEAVTRLLQEKEKDLELTVHIGKELLSQNTQLEKKILELEAELRNANENIAQLNHELVQKTELINILTDNEETLSELASPNTTTNSINCEMLQKKINVLENENKKLYKDVMQVVAETDEMEEHEKRLLQDLNDQLNSSHLQYENITFELERYKEENRLQTEQINNLTHRLSETEIRLHQLLSENEEAYMTLNITKENQNLLATELSEFKSRYQETLTLLQETQMLLREKQRKSQPQSNRSSLYVPGMTISHNPESLQTELMEISLFSENSSLDSGINSDHGHQKQVPQFQKVFDTVKYASNAASHQNGICDSLASELNMLSSQPRMSSSICSAEYNLKPTTGKDMTSFSMYSSIYGSQKSDDAISGTDSDDYNSHRQFGMMGCPGAKDLESALKNLNSAEIVSRRAKLSYGSYSYENSESAHTPESVFSNISASTASSLSFYRYPKKLEIVKPLEGSLTLNQWKGLATPTFGGLLHDNERVKVRGEKGLDEFGLLTYSLGDVEEDVEELPSMKNFESTSQCIYTFTDSKILHPDDGASITFSLPPSQMSSRMHSTCPSRQNTAPPTPRLGLSRRNSCSTFSTNSGLASMLNERGIQAITPSCLNTPSGPNFSPTITPCNSPECNSPPHSVKNDNPEPVSLTSFLTSSAGLIKKKITGHHSHNDEEKTAMLLEKKAMLRSIRLLEKVETLGIENILPITSTSSLSSTSQIINKPLATLHSSNIYSQRYNSPMTQLTSLKHLSDQKKKANNSHNQENMSQNTSVNTNTNIVDSKDNREIRLKHKLQRQKTRRNMNAVQRPDLGTVNGTKAVDKSKESGKQGIVGGFVGSISSIFFGRKGGFL
ncbi:hypothetical protein PVAND_006625 [Polypedilum vanderplanki]|uniref:Trafficking kinesin-binding protein milt n=1 Tax=Polypedilum vanderplanki TaxID=319348 RepID=A0A9J6C490_POLVA|nr:hypothetical protein PVAND_006625 [Polypedilum vanderplanki]